MIQEVPGMKRVTIIVLDSVGAGAAPDAQAYGDAGVNTLNHIAAAVPDMRLPNMELLGLGHIVGLDRFARVERPRGAFGRMMEQSAGKDTTTGHWELAGTIVSEPFPTYPDGFPSDLIDAFERAIGRKTLGNTVASGTEIIAKLGDEHVRTGSPIVYTSADSVFQIAAHESVIPIAEQYKICETARALLTGRHAVGRVIARPFTGESGAYVRTSNRHDYSLEPLKPTVLDHARRMGYTVAGVGKIKDIFAGRGITRSVSTRGNMDGVDQTLKLMKEPFEGILFTNLVDFDMVYGHRNDAAGYASALMDFDRRLPELLSALGPQELLMITADHGCDPTTPGTDHTREYVPILVAGQPVRHGTDLGTRNTFADLAATAAEYLKIEGELDGVSFLKQFH